MAEGQPHNILQNCEKTGRWRALAGRPAKEKMERSNYLI